MVTHSSGIGYKNGTWHTFMLRALMFLDESDIQCKYDVSRLNIYASMMNARNTDASVYLNAMIEAGFIRKEPRPGEQYFYYYITEKGRQFMYLLEDVLAMIKPV